MYQILWDVKAQSDVASLPEKDRRLVIGKIDSLAIDARPPGSTALRIVKGTYRLRAGRWRIFHTVDTEQRHVVISRVMKRDESTYRHLWR